MEQRMRWMHFHALTLRQKRRRRSFRPNRWQKDGFPFIFCCCFRKKWSGWAWRKVRRKEVLRRRYMFETWFDLIALTPHQSLFAIFLSFWVWANFSQSFAKNWGDQEREREREAGNLLFYCDYANNPKSKHPLKGRLGDGYDGRKCALPIAL